VGAVLVTGVTRRCQVCATVKPMTEFNRAGRGYLRRTCIPCFRNQERENYKNNFTVRKNYLAKRKVQSAIRRGDIVMPNLCSNCEKLEWLEAHHDNYNKPLEVRWLCTPCHRGLHPRKGQNNVVRK